MQKKPLKSLSIPSQDIDFTNLFMASTLLVIAALLAASMASANPIPDKSQLTPQNLLGPRPAEGAVGAPPQAGAPRIPTAPPAQATTRQESRRIGLIFAIDDSEAMRLFHINEVRDFFAAQFMGLSGVRWQAIVTNTSYDNEISTIDVRNFAAAGDPSAIPQVILESSRENALGWLAGAMIAPDSFTPNSSTHLDFIRGPLRTLDFLGEVAPDQLASFVNNNDEFFLVSFSIAPSSELTPEQAVPELSRRLGGKPAHFSRIRIPESNSMGRIIQGIRRSAGISGSGQGN